MAQETSPLLAQNNDASAPRSYTRTLAAPLEDEGPGADLGVEHDVESASGDETPKKQMLAILLPVAMGMFLAAMDSTVVASSYASIGNDFNQLQNTSWVATGYMLTLTAFQPLYGKLSDIFGRKGCLLFAYAVFGVGCLACGLAPSMTQLILARVLTGVGGAGMTTVVTILVSDIVPLRQRGTWQGVLNVVLAVGSASGAPLGGIISDNIGWRWAFLLQVPFAFIAFFSVLFALHVPTSASSALSFSSKLRRVDSLGAVTLILAVFSLLLGLDRGGNTGWSSPPAYGSLVASLVLTLLFALIETTPWLAAEPIAPKNMIVNASLLGSYLANLFVFSASMCALFHVPFYVQAVSAKSAADAGLTLIPVIFAGVTGSIVSGVVMQRTGKYYWLTVGAAVGTVAGLVLLASMAMASVAGTLTGMITGLSVMYFGVGIMVTSTLSALIANVTPADQAIATAVSFLFRSLGNVVGVAIGSALVQNMLRIFLTKRLTRSGLDVEEIVRRVRESLSYIDTLDPAMRVVVRGSYEKALVCVFWLSVAMGICALFSSVFIREKSLERPGAAK